jgi:hypothetical protein
MNCSAITTRLCSRPGVVLASPSISFEHLLTAIVKRAAYLKQTPLSLFLSDIVTPIS